MSYKQPRSVQVVVFADTAAGPEFLLLRRITTPGAAWGGFWQAVTGSLEPGETHVEAAIREVYEETGYVARPNELLDLRLVNVFEIAPQWRVKYAPGVTHNEEVCFALRVEKGVVVIDPREHDAFAWAGYEEASRMLYWESSRRAFAALKAVMVDDEG